MRSRQSVAERRLAETSQRTWRFNRVLKNETQRPGRLRNVDVVAGVRSVPTRGRNGAFNFLVANSVESPGSRFAGHFAGLCRLVSNGVEAIADSSFRELATTIGHGWPVSARSSSDVHGTPLVYRCNDLAGSRCLAHWLLGHPACRPLGEISLRRTVADRSFRGLRKVS